jgi:catechol 2,3-dioxygenase-like lactoylglutathione lyase family enzyme
LEEDERMNKGLHHLGLATHDIDRTIAFYTEVLGFEIVRYDHTDVLEGGTMRHVFLDCGRGQTISFLGPKDVPGIPKWDTGINGGLGVPRGFYHFAFHADDETDLVERQADLVAKDIPVSPIIDHDWSRSIYLDDPVNNLSLEFCAYSREFNEDDAAMSTRANVSIRNYNYDNAAMQMAEADKFRILEERGLGKRKD